MIDAKNSILVVNKSVRSRIIRSLDGMFNL